MINSKYRKLVLFLIAALTTTGCDKETIQQPEVNYTHTVTSQVLDTNSTNQLISQNNNTDQSNNSSSFPPLWLWWMAMNNNNSSAAFHARSALNNSPRHNVMTSNNSIAQIAKSTGKPQFFSSLRNNISSNTPVVVRGSSNVSTYGGRSS